MNILAIGNSFSQDATSYVYQIASADKFDLQISNLYIGGCSLQTHWEKASNDLADYKYAVNGVDAGDSKSIKQILETEDFDYIVIQQVSGKSGVEATFYPYIEDLAKYLKTLEPNAELLIHQTWAYATDSTHADFSQYNSNQNIMFEAIKTAYNNAAVNVGKLTLEKGQNVSENNQPLRIIPCGQAFQNARATETFKDPGGTIALNRDGYHANLIHGRYLLGAVWYEAITGKSIANNSYNPGMTSEELEILKECAHSAVTEYGWKVS